MISKQSQPSVMETIATEMLKESESKKEEITHNEVQLHKICREKRDGIIMNYPEYTESTSSKDPTDPPSPIPPPMSPSNPPAFSRDFENNQTAVHHLRDDKVACEQNPSLEKLSRPTSQI